MAIWAQHFAYVYQMQPTAICTPHVIAMNWSVTNMPLKCHTYNFHLHILHNYVSINQYKYFIRSPCNQQCDKVHWYTYLSHYLHMPLKKYTCDIGHTCPTVPLLWFTCYIAYVSKHPQLFFTILLSCMCQQQICPLNGTCMPHEN